MEWYETLAKPSWAPAAPTFGVVWSVLYPIIIVAFGYVIWRVLTGEMPRLVLVPVALNIVSNLAFTPVQFGLRNLELASAVIVIVLATIVWSMVALWPHAPVVSVALVPYLVWVAIATVLQISITLMNR